MFDDFIELLSAFNAHKVRYLVVGGYAVSLHAQPRATKDLDILVSPDSANSEAVYAALIRFGAPVEGLSAKDFTELDSFFRMGRPPVMVDILPRISGVDFEEAWQRRVPVELDQSLTVPFISRQDLIAAKISAGRTQDLADVESLRASLEYEHTEQPSIPTRATQELDEIQQTQAQGRAAWLELRRQESKSYDQGQDGSTNDPGKELDNDLEL